MFLSPFKEEGCDIYVVIKLHNKQVGHDNYVVDNLIFTDIYIHVIYSTKYQFERFYDNFSFIKINLF